MLNLINWKIKMELLREIKEVDAYPGIKSEEPREWKYRRAARAVVFDKDGKVGLLHVSNLGYYKLPGGGIENSEKIEKGLKRECLEEIGCDVIVKQELGEIVEYRNKIETQQTSYCYVAEVVGEKGEPKLEADEIRDGLKPVWVDFEEAIRLVENSNPTSYDGPFIVIRDLFLLKKAKENTNGDK